MQAFFELPYLSAHYVDARLSETVAEGRSLIMGNARVGGSPIPHGVLGSEALQHADERQCKNSSSHVRKAEHAVRANVIIGSSHVRKAEHQTPFD